MQSNLIRNRNRDMSASTSSGSVGQQQLQQGILLNGNNIEQSVLDAIEEEESSGSYNYNNNNNSKIKMSTSTTGAEFDPDLSMSMSIIDFGTVSKWSCSQVSNWLQLKGHDQQYVQLFSDQRIDGKSILLMTELDLRQAPLSIGVLGDLKRLYFDILELQQSCSIMTSHGLSCSSGNTYLPFPLPIPTADSQTGVFRSLSKSQSHSKHSLLQIPSSSNSLSASQIHINSHQQLPPKRIPRRRKRKVSFVTESDSSQLSDDTADPDDDLDLQSQSDVTPKESSSASKILASNGHAHGHSGTNGHSANGLERSYDRRRQGRHASSASLEPEVGKAFVAMLYVFCVTWLTAVVMVIVHDRVPDMEKYPPLPDLFLDNMPHIPWAFEMCEVTGTVLFCLFLGVLFFHKHRFILIRRFFALCGTVFSLRCFTMLITSLSVPGAHLKCNPRPYGDWTSRLYNAYLIWKGAGMSIQGVRTCGDYMFSGHTVALTMLNFFVTEYTTRRLYFIHTLSWLLNMFGIFFILAAHEHYSIDVFIAFYITSRLFLYYHTLANNQALMQRDSKRTKVWFPLFSYFESKVDGIVPNHYEWPITPRRMKRWCGATLRILESKWKEIIPHPNERFFRLKVFFKPTVTKDD